MTIILFSRNEQVAADSQKQIRTLDPSFAIVSTEALPQRSHVAFVHTSISRDVNEHVLIQDT